MPTLAPIDARFPAEWVRLEDPATTDLLEVRGGRVLWHRQDRDEVYRKALALRPRRSAIWDTGSLPEGMAVLRCACADRYQRGQVEAGMGATGGAW